MYDPTFDGTLSVSTLSFAYAGSCLVAPPKGSDGPVHVDPHRADLYALLSTHRAAAKILSVVSMMSRMSGPRRQE